METLSVISLCASEVELRTKCLLLLKNPADSYRMQTIPILIVQSGASIFSQIFLSTLESLVKLWIREHIFTIN